MNHRVSASVPYCSIHSPLPFNPPVASWLKLVLGHEKRLCIFGKSVLDAYANATESMRCESDCSRAYFYRDPCREVSGQIRRPSTSTKSNPRSKSTITAREKRRKSLLWFS